MNKRRSRLLLAVAIGIATTGWAATPSTQIAVSGRVRDADTGAPLAAVQVFIESMNVGALTDGSGTYLLLVPGDAIGSEVEVTFERIGYGSVVKRIAEGRLVDGTVTLDVRMAEEALQLDEVVVTGDGSTTRAPTTAGNVPTADAPSRSPDDTRGARPDPVPTRMEAEVRVVEPGPAAAASPLAPPSHGRNRFGGTPYNREQYDHFADNDFRTVADHPLSTFSIDVDRASYSNVRRFLLREHRAPPPDAVQVEEMINYFSYDYDMPEGDDPVGITTELGVAPWARDHRLLRIGLATRPIVTEDMPPSNLVFLLDVSGSMRSWDKLPLVKRSLRLLVEQLRPEDRVAIAVYAGAAGLVLESTPGSRKDRILEAIDRLEAGGSTAGGAGLALAYRVARENFVRDGNNRVILATDGDFNVGPSSDAAMVRLIEERRDQGTFLTVLGFGTGNLQSAKMQGIAQHGNGNYAYIDSLDEARKMFIGEMGGTLLTVAQDVKIQVEFNPANVAAYRLVGYENRLLADEDFNDDRKDAGEMGAGHRVTALYEIVPAEGGERDGRVDPLRYQRRRAPAERTRGDELAFVRLRYKQPGGTESRLMERPVGADVDDPSDDFQFASAVAGFGMLLRSSPHAGSMTVRRVLALAEDGLGADLDGYRGEFLELVRAYERLPHHDRR